MALHSFALQQSIFTKITSGTLTDVAGTSITTKVFDDVPEGTSYPYVIIGEETAINFGTKDKDANEHTILHNTDITVSGASLVNIRHEFEQTLLEADGITRHGVMRFRVVIFDS